MNDNEKFINDTDKFIEEMSTELEQLQKDIDAIPPLPKIELSPAEQESIDRLVFFSNIIATNIRTKLFYEVDGHLESAEKMDDFINELEDQLRRMIRLHRARFTVQGDLFLKDGYNNE